MIGNGSHAQDRLAVIHPQWLVDPPPGPLPCPARAVDISLRMLVVPSIVVFSFLLAFFAFIPME